MTALGKLLRRGCAALLFAGCAGPEPVMVQERDTGKLIELTRGQMLEVRLYADPASGYRWIQIDPQKSCLRKGDSEFRPVSGAKGGWQIQRFHAGARGASVLKLEYRAPGEREPRESVHYRITVDWPASMPPPLWENGEARVVSG